MNTSLNSAIRFPWHESVLARRSFQAETVPARRLYFLDFPLLLLTVGLATWIFSTDAMLFVSALTGALVGLYTLWEIIARHAPLRFSHIFCIANLVGYGLGTMNSWLTLPCGDLSLAASFNRDTEAVACAMAAILFCSAVLYSRGELYEKPIFRKDFKLVLDNRAITFVLIGTGIVPLQAKNGQEKRRDGAKH